MASLAPGTNIASRATVKVEFVVPGDKNVAKRTAIAEVRNIATTTLIIANIGLR